MNRTRRRAIWLGASICVLYALTWVVAETTLAANLKRNLFDDWEVFAKDKSPATPTADLRAKIPQWAEEHRFEVHVTRVVPIFPAVVLAWHGESAAFNPGGTSGFGASHRTIFLVYGVGSRALYSKTTEVAP